MSFTTGTLVGFKSGDGSITYGNIGIPASGNAKGRFYVHLKEKNVRGQHMVLPPLSSLFIPDKVKCECGDEECENTGMYSRDDMTEGLNGFGELWFHPDCIDRDQGDFNYCSDCNLLCHCDTNETLHFEATGILDFCPKCWEHVSEEDRKEGRKDIE